MAREQVIGFVIPTPREHVHDSGRPVHPLLIDLPTDRHVYARPGERPLTEIVFLGVGNEQQERLSQVRTTISNGNLTAQPDRKHPLMQMRGLNEKAPDRPQNEPSTIIGGLNVFDSFGYAVSSGDEVHDVHSSQVEKFRRRYNPRYQLLTTEYVWLQEPTDQSEKEQRTNVRVTQFTSKERPSLAVMNITLKPDHSGKITIDTGIDGQPFNGTEDFYVNRQSQEDTNGNIVYKALTKYKGHTVAVGQRVVLMRNGEVVPPEEITMDLTKGEENSNVRRLMTFDANAGDTYSLTVVSSYHSTADKKIMDELEYLGSIKDKHVREEALKAARLQRTHMPRAACLQDLEGIPSFETLITEHKDAWERKRWSQTEIRIVGDDEVQTALEFNHSHILSEVDDYPYAGIGAKKGRRVKEDIGEGYGDRTFWDADLYNLDSLTPSQMRTYLEYRFKQLQSAREKAQKFGNTGAFWPWESANPVDGEAGPERAKSATGEVRRIESISEEIHISADIAFTAMKYYWMTHDTEFLRHEGAEMILEAARFYKSRAFYNEAEDRFEFLGVTGPDEYHDGVDNDAYTNGMAKWAVMKAAQLYKEGNVSEAVQQNLGITHDEVTGLRDFAEKIYIPFDTDTMVIDAFAGWSDLVRNGHIDLTKTPFVGVTEMDGFLQKNPQYISHNKPTDAEGLRRFNENPIRYTDVIKQPAVTLLTNVLDAELLTILPQQKLDELYGKGLTDDEIVAQTKTANQEAYDPQDCAGSSLAPNKLVETALDAGVDPNLVYEQYRKAVLMDLLINTHKTENGLHTAAAGGSIQATRAFGGIRVREKELAINPRLPSRWQEYHDRSFYGGVQYQLDIDREANTITFTLPEPSDDAEVPVNIRGISETLSKDTPSITVTLEGAPEVIDQGVNMQPNTMYPLPVAS